METKTVSTRVPSELHKRLETVASKLDLDVSDVTKHAIRAAVEEIERQNYEIHWPPKFRLIARKRALTDAELVELSNSIPKPGDGDYERFLETMRSKSRSQTTTKDTTASYPPVTHELDKLVDDTIQRVEENAEPLPPAPGEPVKPPASGPVSYKPKRPRGHGSTPPSPDHS